MPLAGRRAMKLFLHVGTEKTGSSHIQTLCVHGREHLASAGIWFPEGIARHEKRMRAGLVSAGNAFVVSTQAREGNHGGLLAELVRHREAAQARSCRAVFLSSELLLPYCATVEAWSAVFENCQRAGFDSVSTLVLLRDPVDQLISLYKHRARSGTAGRLVDWVRNCYNLPDELARLRGQAHVAGIELIARGYVRRPGGLEAVFFGDWLGTRPPALENAKEVNPSLALPELELLRVLHQIRPVLVPFLYDQLAQIPSADKVQGSALESHARRVAEAKVWEHREEWRAWNAILPAGEQLAVPKDAAAVPPAPEELGFSVRQVDALARFNAETATLKFWAQAFWAGRVKPVLRSIRRRFLPFAKGT